MMLWKLLYTGLLCASMLALSIVRHAAPYYIACAALAFSWLGDATLASFRPLTRHMANQGLWGMGFFAAAHVCYVLAFALYMRAWPQQGWRTPLLTAGCAAAAIVIWYALCARSGQPIQLKTAALAYAFLLMLMAGLAVSISTRAGAFVWPLVLGGALFVISDGMIALEWFAGWSRPWHGAAVWATYAPAQLMLTAGFFMMRMPPAAAVSIGL
jgi:hypothetical protein